MHCDYCDGDKDGYVSFLPKINKGFNASVHRVMNEPQLIVTGAHSKGVFRINFCPMCGKALTK